ncbi:p53-like transcription factor [Trichodelitschia bisporula]|uniref:p53-like transcription factor n=1 Tax=Trichodelitschia bisporula TaxID=703511 RepID=A0A6G1I5P7_9PEZI|nr:p53-like transcription factor [Trichodelitschia bisporula]
MSLSPGGLYTNPASMGYGVHPTSDPSGSGETPPFASQQDLHEITCEGQPVKPHIEAKIEKGFFYSGDMCWTCYRRNYFSVQCSYTLTPHIPGRPLYLTRSSNSSSKQPEQIQALAMSLSAAVDGAQGKAIDLVQHTPKRDKGPQTPIQITKLCPTPPGGTKLPHLHHHAADPHSPYGPLAPYGSHHHHPHHHPPNAAQPPASPYLPLQQVPDPDQPNLSNANSSSGAPPGSASAASYLTHPPSPTAHQHTFERIQFKSATANNGKRRAQQQYYHLIVELWADVRLHHDLKPNWVKVAQRASSQVVVRGRSPSHYQNEGPSGGPRGGSATGGPGGGIGGLGGIGSMGLRGGLGGGHSLSGYAGLGGGYRGTQYAAGTEGAMGSVSSGSAGTGENVELPVSEAATPVKQATGAYDGYQYYPSPLYELPLPPVKSEVFGDLTTRKEEGVSGSAAAGLFGSGGLFTGGVGRFQGVHSSRGYYAVDSVY